MIRDTIETLLRRQDLTREAAARLMGAIVSGELTDAQIAGVAIALRAKGETVDEIAGFVTALRGRALRVTPARNTLVDTCGTGGDGTHTFNISTAAAFVAAGAGVHIAKHGNRALSSRCGSTDVLEALGIHEVPAGRVAELIDRTGIGFMFAPAHHPALRHAATARRELGVRTVFNLLGPMANPAFVKRQLVGVFDPVHTETVARVLASLGSEHVYVVHGSDGSDEVTIAGETRVTSLHDGHVETWTFTPESVGIPRASTRALTGGTPEENAGIILAILDGAMGARRDAVVLNAAFVICAGGRAQTIEEGVQAAAESIDSGRARAVVELLRAVTAGMATAAREARA
ncbi:MAG: anthranilate phosphoribosyltransferase [Candidatus Krumholzibacteria bacterium]|nr:anthranilate phosphoribosyltransferase [Candidatus Krumholzibacteria bacterium]MDH4337608.1 anthranilate phosphoribosyltransferase [Candidatus Krumholzibacteria bacterium]